MPGKYVAHAGPGIIVQAEGVVELCRALEGGAKGSGCGVKGKILAGAPCAAGHLPAHASQSRPTRRDPPMEQHVLFSSQMSDNGRMFASV